MHSWRILASSVEILDFQLKWDDIQRVRGEVFSHFRYNEAHILRKIYMYCEAFIFNAVIASISMSGIVFGSCIILNLLSSQ